MKKLLFLFLILIMPKLFGQPDCGKNPYMRIIHMDNDMPLNALSVTFQPVDLGYGMKYDRRLVNQFGAFISLAKGYYWVPSTILNIQHYKLAIGMNYYTLAFDNMQNCFSVGFSYHNFSNSIPAWLYEVYDSGTTHYRLQHWSFELGCSMRIGKRFTSGFRFDFLRNESNVDMGISF